MLSQRGRRHTRSVAMSANTLLSAAPLRGRTVGEQMTNGVIRCAPETPLRSVARLMADRRVHAIFVFDYGREDDETVELWGLVSDLDVVAAAAGNIDARTARDTAVTPLVSVTTDTSLQQAGQLMAQNGVSHLAVLDPQSHRPVGVLSTLDIARAVGDDVTGETVTRARTVPR
jgi:CBS domain-containing protein